MRKLLNFLDGYKTYTFAISVALVVFLDVAEILPTNQSLAMLGLIGAGTVASMRHAIEKLEK